MNLFSSALRLTVLAGVLLLGTLSAPDARADSIGINFTGGDTTNNLAALEIAGVMSQANWNGLAGASGTSAALLNNLGATTTTTLTYAAQDSGSSISAPAGGNEKINNGFLTSSQNTAMTFTLNNISFSNYDIYLYNLGEPGIQQRTTLGSTSYFGTSPSATDADHLDGNALTPYIYTRTTSTSAGTFTPNADYVRFTGLSGTSQSFTMTGLNSYGYVSAIQLVQTSPVPEPSTHAMMFLGVGALGLMTWKRKRSMNSDAYFAAEAI